MNRYIAVLLAVVATSVGLFAREPGFAKRNSDEVKYTISLSRFSQQNVDGTILMYTKAKAEFDALVKRVGFGSVVGVIGSIIGLAYLNSGTTHAASRSASPPKERASRADTDETALTIFFKRLMAGLGMGLGVPLAGLFLYGVVFPASKKMNKIVTKYINLLVAGYNHWYINARNAMLRATYELHEALNRTRMHFSHERPGESDAREGRIEMYDRSNVGNLYNHFLRNYTRVVALMSIRLSIGSEGIMAERATEVGSMINVFAENLEGDLNRFEHGMMPYFSRKTLQLFTIVREQVHMLIHEFNGSLDASRDQLLWGDETYDMPYTIDSGD